jgi:hypothetical protein
MIGKMKMKIADSRLRQKISCSERSWCANSTTRRRIETGRRLVEEHQVRVAHERDAEIEPSLLPTGERLHLRIALLVEADERDHLVDVAASPVVAGEHPVDLTHCQVRPELRLLQDDTDPLAEVASGARRVAVQHLDRAAVAGSVALEDLDRRRLSRAVRAEQAEDLALLDLEADASQRLVIAVRLAQVDDADGCHRARIVGSQSASRAARRCGRRDSLTVQR